MVLFGAYHTAERFHDHNRLTAHFPGPGSYDHKSVVDGASVPRYASKLVEDGCLRPDGGRLLFRGRDAWVRGGEGPKGLTSLSADNQFTSPTLYRMETAGQFVRHTTPTAFLDTQEARYLSPSTRCLTPDHERAAKGAQSPGPGAYYPFYEAWDFPPPEDWDDVNKIYRPPRRRFNTKTGWGDPIMPRPPTPAMSEKAPSKDERLWLRKRRGSIRPSTSPRCMWITGVSTRGGLQAWGDLATKIGPMNVGRNLDCAPRAQTAPRTGSASEHGGPVHSTEARSTSPGFREVRYLGRELMRRAVGTGRDTPGPGSYNVRPRMKCGTMFAAPRPRGRKAAAGGNRAIAVAAMIAAAKHDAIDQLDAGCVETPKGGRHLPSSYVECFSQQRSSAPLQGKGSPGPAYNLPSDFDIKRINKKVFYPPPCSKARTPSCRETGRKRERRRGPASVAIPDTLARSGRQSNHSLGMADLSRARHQLVQLMSATAIGGGSGGPVALAVPVNTTMGRGFLLAVRADGMSFVRLPWGVLYTSERLTWGTGEASGAVGDIPVVSISRDDNDLAQEASPAIVGGEVVYRCVKAQ